MDKPLVSVITMVLNSKRFLEEHILSVLNQTYPNIEHIFVDGQSTDGSLELIQKYAKHFPERIRYISEEDNSAVEAWNKGWKLMRGELVGWLGADDLYEPDSVQTIVDFFNVNPSAYFVYGDCNLIDARGKVIGKYPVRDFKLSDAINDAVYLPTPSAFYRREVIDKVGFMDVDFPICNDADYWIRVGKEYRLHRIHQVLSNFRFHDKNISSSVGIERKQAIEGYIINRRYRGKLLSPRVARYLVYKYAGWMVPLVKPIWRFVRGMS